MAGLLETKAAEIDRRIAELGVLRQEIELLRRRARRLDAEDCSPSRVRHLITNTER